MSAVMHTPLRTALSSRSLHARSSAAPHTHFEPLDSRQLLAADLAVTMVDNVPSFIVPGDKLTLAATISNVGDTAASGPVTVRFLAPTNNADDPIGVVATVTKKINLKPGATAVITAKIVMNDQPSPGVYDYGAMIEAAGALNASADNDESMVEGGFDLKLIFGNYADRRGVVMTTTDEDGTIVTYDPAENRHRHHILDISIVPARISPAVKLEAAAIARRVAEALDYRGILGVEFFLKTDGELLVNEIAPRPHNSGHHTLDACVTSQFTQQLRAVIGLPLGSTRLLTPVVMLNLLGDFWQDETTPPDWLPLFEDREISLHLYGKRHARGRRKMGHANIIGTNVESALARAEALKARWLAQGSNPNG